MLTVGLTGSIAVGKSFVSDLLRDSGCYVLDADQTAREVVESGSVGLEKIVEAFGTSVLAVDGSLDRKALGAIVFADGQKRNLLNSIVHPLVIEAQDRWLKDIRSADSRAIAVIDAALMIESGGWKRFDKLIVVWCKPELQLRRLMTRDGLTEVDANGRIATQMSQEEKKKFADYLIDSSEGFEDTRRQVTELVKRLREVEQGR